MNIQIQKAVIQEISEAIDIPDSAYEAAVRRYEDLGEWLGSNVNSKCAQYNPHIFAQGSFRLGTVTRPIGRDEYDLDLSCEFRKRLTKENITQEQLKNLLGEDLETYRKERGIQQVIVPKKRCWRLKYKDGMKFHMDTVPCLPGRDDIQLVLQERMIKAGMDGSLAERVAHLAVAITDENSPTYTVISPDWGISNPEGYAQWFESRMQQAPDIIKKRMIETRVAKINDFPTYKWRTPLQRCVQMLKRHRDVMFEKNPDAKPVSVIITTLSGLAYQGEATIESTMAGVLNRLGGFIRNQRPRVPNPINPEEDFADKWPTEKGRELRLEENFWAWLKKAQKDFAELGSSDDLDFLCEAGRRFGATLSSDNLKKKIRSTVGLASVSTGLADKKPKQPVDHRGGGRFG